MTSRLRLPVLSAALFAIAVSAATAQSAAQTAQDAANVVEQWGLIGSWSRDCRLAPKPGVLLLIYEKRSDGSVVRTTGNGTAEPMTSRILSARKRPDGSLEITEKDPEDVMTYVLSKDGSGKHRSMSSRDAKGHTYIRNGKFLNKGNKTPLLARCD
jgi:hypothetical protein